MTGAVPALARLAVCAGALALIAITVAATGLAPARAAASGISLSLDGVRYAPTIAEPLFGTSRLVPDDAITRSFWVRNDAASAGYLRLTLRDPSTTNIDFADALSLRADLVGWPGEVVALQSARPCARLSEGPIVAAGSAARVDLTAALGDLEGLHGQGGSAAFTVVVSLSAEPQGLGRSGCPSAGSGFAGFPDLGGNGSRRLTGGTVFSTTPEGWMPLSAGTPVTSVDGGAATTTPTGTPERRLAVSANSARFYQEWDVALWLVALLLGGLGTLLLGRRRHRAARRR